MSNLPVEGVGCVYSPGLDPFLEAAGDLIDVIEVEPQTLWFKSRSQRPAYRLAPGAIERLGRFRQRKLVHGVGMPVGGTVPSDGEHLAAFAESIAAFSPPWASEHLSFNRAAAGDDIFGTGFLLPPLQTAEGVAVAVANIRRLSACLSVPFAFETGVNYLHPLPGEMSDGSFFRAVAEEADCGILLDLHNLWSNEKNGRQAVLDTLGELPLERVWEMHLAGGQTHCGYWLDAHSDLVPAPLMELAAQVMPLLPNLRALVFEIVADYLSLKNLRTEDLLDQIRAIRRIWEGRAGRGRLVPTSSKHSRTAGVAPRNDPDFLPAPGVWEETLGSLVIGRAPNSSLAPQLASDPGIEIFRQLVASVRAGMTASTLTLTWRYLTLRIGEARARSLLEDFWKSEPPELFASEEAHKFGAYLSGLPLGIPHLEDVLGFELASQEALIEGSARSVSFSCDPVPLLTALGEGRLPDVLVPGAFELRIDPSSISGTAHAYGTQAM